MASEQLDMIGRVELVWLGGQDPPDWPLGRVHRVAASGPAIADCLARELGKSDADAWLFWAGRLGLPDARRVGEALGRPGDVWHAGLRLGMAGLPRAIDFVAPTWMLNCDPDPSIEATSWRLSLEACLVRTDVLRRLGGVRPEFETLAAAGLELGHRWVTRGALMRSLPGLLPVADAASRPIPLVDEMRFVYYRFGRFWLRWSLFRSVVTKGAGLSAARAVRRRIEHERVPPTPAPLREAVADNGLVDHADRGSVTVLIPTVDRYPYLETLLEQLGRQTVRPLEIIIVDQTSREHRRTDLEACFPDLPLRVFHRDHAGQCSSRNAGIEASRGDFLILLDDDVEVGPDLIANHLHTLKRFRCEVSSGVSEEVGAGPLPAAFRLIRSSDVFPAGNSLLSRSALSGAGLFDLSYDHGPRADADLGMRLYLSGNLMILDPNQSVLHHHAPSGGLRKHGARVITYASSRKRLAHRHLPATTEIYLAMRYFSARQVHEFLWLQAAATSALKGTPLRRTLKAIVAVAMLPDTWRQIRRRAREARAMLAAGPKIPALPVSPRDASLAGSVSA